jgi:hypothetical protein
MATKIWVGTDTGNEGDWATAANWLPSGVPANGDDVYFENSSQSVTEGFDQSAVALASLNIAQSYSGSIGDSDEYLQIGASLLKLGYHYGPGEAGISGSGMLKIDLGTTASTIIIFNSGLSTDETKPAIRLKCNNAATTLEVRKGEVGIANETAETSTLATITIGYVDNVDNDANVYIGSGVTLTTLTKKGGFCLLRCAATTINNYAGELQTEGAGAVTTFNAIGGEIISNSTGAITTLHITKRGDVDFTRSGQARTITTCIIDDEGEIKFDPNVITFTNKIISNNPVKLTASAA